MNPGNICQRALLLASATVLFARADHINPFTGTWKLNVAKSKFSPGPAARNVTVTSDPDGTFKVDAIDGEGRSIKWSHARSGGAAVAIEGIENATILTQMHGHALDDTMKIGGKVAERVHAVVSPDGKTMTTTIDMTADDPAGPGHNVLFYEKQ